MQDQPTTLLRVYDHDGSYRYALIDLEDYERLTAHRWRLSNGYAVRGQPLIGLHREVLHMPPYKPGDPIVDHISRNRLDDRKENLRVVTHTTNALNRGSTKDGIKADGLPVGVTQLARNVWLAAVRHGGIYIIKRQTRTKETAIELVRQAREQISSIEAL